MPCEKPCEHADPLICVICMSNKIALLAGSVVASLYAMELPLGFSVQIYNNLVKMTDMQKMYMKEVTENFPELVDNIKQFKSLSQVLGDNTPDRMHLSV